MRIITAVALVILATGPVFAQGMGINLLPEDKKADPVAEAKREEAERAYKAATKKIPDQQLANDPWGNVRGTAEVKAAPAKPRTVAKKP